MLREPCEYSRRDLIRIVGDGIDDDIGFGKCRGKTIALPRIKTFGPGRRAAAAQRGQIDIEGDQHVGFETTPEIVNPAVLLTANAHIVTVRPQAARERRLPGGTRSDKDDSTFV
jgi:hypothetical protein